MSAELVGELTPNADDLNPRLRSVTGGSIEFKEDNGEASENARQFPNQTIATTSRRPNKNEGCVSEDELTDYLRQITKTPLLKAEQEVELAKRIEVGVLAGERLTLGRARPQLKKELTWLVSDGLAAKDQLITANLKLVVYWAKKYRHNGLAMMDLIQEGNLGLIRAVEMFDYKKGNKFITYATWWIRQCLIRAIANQRSTIRIPVHMGEGINRLLKAQQSQAQELGREPTIDEITVKAKMKPDTVKRYLDYHRTAHTLSLDCQLNPDETDSEAIVDELSDKAEALSLEDMVCNGIILAQLVALLRGTPELSELQRDAIILREGFNGEPMSFEQIGEAQKSPSREKSRKAYYAGIAILRVLAVEEGLDAYLQ